MSTSDPRPEDGRHDEPATAVAAGSPADPTDSGRHAAPTTGADGAIRDSERDDVEDRTRVLPTSENGGESRHAADDHRTAQEDHRLAEDDRQTSGARTVAAPVVAPPPPADRTVEAQRPMDHRTVLQREKEQFGGMRFWLAFFGWLTATGLAVLLGAIAAGILTAVGNSNGATSSSTGLQSLGIAGAIVTAVILFVAYYAGGYVAGRMARFDGVKQGVAVWLWAIIISILAAIAGAIGSQFGFFSQIGNIAQVPINAQTFTAAGIIGIAAALLLSLLGAVLGGLAGMHYHRKVDRSAFGA